MSDLRALIPQAQRTGSKPVVIGMWFGKFASPAPLAITDLAWVTLPDVSADNLWGPCRWEPRIHEVTVNVAEGVETAHNVLVGRILLPVVGNECLVALDNRRDPWIVRWWPA